MTSLRRYAEVALGTIVIAGTIYLLYWRDIRATDLYQRNFNTSAWHQKKLDSAARIARMEQLDKQECLILLSAKQQAMQIELERYTLYGFKPWDASKMAQDDFDEASKNCLLDGINPDFDQTALPSKPDCARYPGIYGC